MRRGGTEQLEYDQTRVREFWDRIRSESMGDWSSCMFRDDKGRGCLRPAERAGYCSGHQPEYPYPRLISFPRDRLRDAVCLTATGETMCAVLVEAAARGWRIECERLLTTVGVHGIPVLDGPVQVEGVLAELLDRCSRVNRQCLQRCYYLTFINTHDLGYESFIRGVIRWGVRFDLRQDTARLDPRSALGMAVQSSRTMRELRGRLQSAGVLDDQSSASAIIAASRVSREDHPSEVVLDGLKFQEAHRVLTHALSCVVKEISVGNRSKTNVVRHVDGEPGCGLNEIESHCRTRLEEGDRSAVLVGLLVGRPDLEMAREHVIPHLRHWHYRSADKLDLFCLGFVSDGTFDEESFNQSVRNLEEATTWRYSGGTELLLFRALKVDGAVHLDFEVAVHLRLEQAVEEGVITMPQFIDKIIIFAASSDSDHPAWDFSDVEGVGVARNAVIKWLCSLLPGDIGTDLRSARHFAVRDVSKAQA